MCGRKVGICGDVVPFANEVFPVGVCGFGDGAEEEAGSFADYYVRGEREGEDLKDGGVSERGDRDCWGAARVRFREGLMRLVVAAVVMTVE